MPFGVVVNVVVVADIVVVCFIFLTMLSIGPLHLVVMNVIWNVNVLMVVVVVVV